MIRRNGFTSTLFSILALAVAAERGVAEEAALEEIVVTATKRTERLQDVPATVQVFDAAALAAAGIHSPQQLFDQIPAFSSNSSKSRSVVYATMRGVGRVGGRPAVGYFVDGVEQMGLFGHLMRSRELFDIERIEVLKGPQPTLYGRDALGGVIAVLHNSPTQELEMFGELQVANYDKFHAMAGVNLPISDIAAFRGHAYYSRRDGYEDSLTADNVDGEEPYGAYATLLIAPDNGLSVTAIVDYFNNEGHNAQFARFFTPRDESAVIRNLAPGRIGMDVVERATSVLKASYDFGSMRLDSISAYTDFDQFFWTDNDFSEFPGTRRGSERDNTTFSQEIRLTSPDERRFRWMLGGYFVDETWDENFNTFVEASGRTAHRLATTDTRQTSVFVDAEYDLTPRLELALGARFARETLDAVFSDGSGPGEFLEAIPAGIVMVPGLPFSSTDENVLPRASIRYGLSDRTSVYSSVAKGYTGAQFAAAGLDQDERTVDAEEAWSYELGLKTSLLEQALLLNVAGFYTRWRDMQIIENRFIPSFRSIFDNDGDSRILGAEIEATLAPTDETTFGFAATAMDSEVTDVKERPGVPVNPLTEGEPIPNVASLSINAFAQRDFQLTARLEAFIRLEWDYTSSRRYSSELATAPFAPIEYFNNVCTSVGTLPGTAVPAYRCSERMPEMHRVNARLGFEFDRLEVDFFIHNIFDERIPEFYTGFRVAADHPSRIGAYSLPRLYGVTLRTRF